MNRNVPLTPCPAHRTGSVVSRVVTTALLRERGLTTAQITARCAPGGPWRTLLPGVHLLHPGHATGEELLHAALVYAGRPPAAGRARAARDREAPAPGPEVYGDAMLTGRAALALHGFDSVPGLAALRRVDVLVPRTRRLRSTGFVRVVRSSTVPDPVRAGGFPAAPVERAVADAAADMTDAASVHRLLTDAVRVGHVEPAAVVRELNLAELLGRPAVVAAMDALLAEGRSLAEDRLYAVVHGHGLPEPVWNVDIRLPGGPCVGAVDAYWPEQAVAVVLDTRVPRRGAEDDEGRTGPADGAEREHLERLGITVVRVSPKRLREEPAHPALVVRTALMAAEDREPAAYVRVLPR
ncbi:hypothetical protein [uncultured Streptomyces sp.]|uniref:hypothetical protein n=1 Tax=uncultured Streptomyces sp. TaxID=174707 RepID=UPI0026066ABC|nr:hypothetical protein [uncultured Streptomyces sp.]